MRNIIVGVLIIIWLTLFYDNNCITQDSEASNTTGGMIRRVNTAHEPVRGIAARKRRLGKWAGLDSYPGPAKEQLTSLVQLQARTDHSVDTAHHHHQASLHITV